MTKERIYSPGLMGLSPRGVNTREEMLNTLDRMAVEAGAKNARVFDILNGNRTTGVKALDTLMSVSDAVLGSMISRLPQGRLVEGFEKLDLNMAMFADSTVRAPLEWAKTLKRANTFLRKMGEPPLTDDELFRFNVKTGEGFKAQYNGEVDYLDDLPEAKHTVEKERSEGEQQELENLIEELSFPMEKGQVPVPRSRPSPTPRAKPDRRTDPSTFEKLDKVPEPARKPVPVPVAKFGPGLKAQISTVNDNANPFSIRNPKLKQQAEMLERNPIRAKQLILAAKRDPELFGLV
jgi:hypothetical protein